jgi:hypothetical protein
MDIDENDILFTNQYINESYDETVPVKLNNEFRRFYREQVEKNKRDSTIKIINKLENQITEDFYDDNLIENTSKFEIQKEQGTSKEDSNNTRKKREKKTFVSIDSRDRDKLLFVKPSYFKIGLGKTFYNIASVKLASLEFPNTNAVINTNNNKIFWRNLEDIENDNIDIKTNTYPVYEVTLRTGSYTITTLQKEIATKLSQVRKSDGTFHYADVTLDYDTDIVNITFINLKLLEPNAIKTSQNSAIIEVQSIGHGFNVGDIIYFRDVSSVGGLTSSTLNSSFRIITATQNSFTFEVNTRASTATPSGGGGTKIRCGKAAPFQLLWGDYQHTVAFNLGYPYRNSADRIDETITYIAPVNLIQVETLVPHNLLNTYDFVNQEVTLGNVDLELAGNKKIIKVVSPTIVELLVSSAYNGLTNSSNSPFLRFGTLNPVPINTIRSVPTNLLQVQTLSNHGYDLSHINSTLNFFNTTSFPTIDGLNTLYAIPNKNTLIVPGRLERNGQVGVPTEQLDPTNFVICGNLPFNDPLSSVAFNVLDAEIIGTTLLQIRCSPLTINFGGELKQIYNVDDLLSAGDTINIFNLTTLPRPLTRFTIQSIINNNTINITIDSETLTFIELQKNINGELITTVGTDLMFLTLPSHGFNKILNYYSSSETVTLTISSLELDPNTPNRVIVGYTSGRTLRVNEFLTNFNLSSPYDTTFVGSYRITEVLSNSAVVIDSTGSGFTNTNTVNNPGTMDYLDKFIVVDTLLDHKLQTYDSIRIMQTGNTLLDKFHKTIRVIDADSFAVYNPFGQTIESSSTNGGIIGMSDQFFLYNAEPLGDIPSIQLNSKPFVPIKIIDDNIILFKLNEYATHIEKGGGINIHINSLKHGFSGTQTNTENGVLFRSISLEGEQYAFLRCPVLGTVISTGVIKDIFARISLSESPGAVIFDSFLSNPKLFDEGSLPSLDALEFSVTLHDNSFYDFNDLDFSFTLEITEHVDYLENTNLSSRRGVLEHI